MTDFEQKFVENPAYLKWIFNSNPDVDRYWEQYLLDHPEEKDRVLELKDHLADLKFSNAKLSAFEKIELKQRIKSSLSPGIPAKKSRLLIQSFMKYAAIAIIFAVIGGLIVYLNTNRESIDLSQVKQLATVPYTAQGPLLITSNGKNIQLKKSSSTVDYTQKGEIVLNNDSIIRPSEEEDHTLNQLVIPYGNQSRVVLSDNTVVWLNSGSRLIYPSHFNGKTREVMLYGEAFFEVSRNPEKPFIVKTSELDVKVLGTQFNVSAYAEDNTIQTVLREGSVALRRKNAGLFDKDVVLKPNQLASFDKMSNNTKINEVDVSRYILWTKGMISFDETDIVRVIKKLERFYNISINFSDPHKEIIRISGKLDLLQGRQEAMEYLEKVSLLKFTQINENQFSIN